MKAREDIFKLIKSLSRSEKRYFTLDAKKSSNTKSGYLELFQAINKMEEYDEQSLKADFPNLAYDKSYLYEAILRAMRDFRSTRSKGVQIKEKLIDARFLYERGLYRQCEERLKAAGELALQISDALALYEVLREKRRLLREVQKSNFVNRLDEAINEKSNLQNIIAQESELLDLYDRTLRATYQQKWVAGLPDIHQQLDQLLSTGGAPPFSELQRRYFLTKGLAAILENNFDDLLKYFELLNQWWVENPLMKKEYYYYFLSDLVNLAYAFWRNSEHEKLKIILKTLEVENPRSFHEKRMYFYRYTMFKLLYLMNTGQLKAAMELVPDIQAGIREYPSDRALLLATNLAVLFFINGNYEQCARQAIQLLKNKKYREPSRARDLLTILQLISVYECEDFEAFEKTLRSARRYFKGRKSEKSSFAKLIVHELAAISKLPFAGQKAQYKILFEKIDRWHQDTSEGAVIGLGETHHWLKQKLESL